MKHLWWFLFISVCLHSLLFAGDNPRNVTAVRISAPMKIDGLLDEPQWKSAPPADGFIQKDPQEGMPGSQKSEIKVLYDDDALYFGCTFHDTEPDKIVSRLSRRDDQVESDAAAIYIDSYHDHQTGFQFMFNVSGVKVDVIQYDDGNNSDDSWDPVWDLQTQKTAEGWTAEIKIPFRILRYRKLDSDTAENVMGINFFRYISRRQESQYWAFTPKKETGFISRFGHLLGLRNLPDPKRFEVIPFVVGKQRYDPATAVMPRVQEFTGNGGFDLKYGISSNFSVDATVNPDFGQVEADPAVLNLSAFETFYPEKRPFFIEGTQILHFTTFGGTSGPGMFYSRRIGRALSPDEVDPMGGYIESMPQATTILGAAKITGKTNNGLSVGVLEAATQEENATVVDSSGIHHTELIEPFANYNVVRLKQDILENSNIGTIFTSTVKDSRFPAFTNGYDWNINLDKNTYELYGFFALSHTTNSNMERVTGNAGKFDFGKIAGEHWTWNFNFDWTGKKYNIDDIGFFFSPNDIGDVLQLNYKENTPGDIFRNYNANIRYHTRWNFDGYNLFKDATVSGGVLFTNYWEWNWGIDHDYGDYDQFETRGNGLYKKPANSHFNTSISTDSRGMIVMNAGGELDRTVIGARAASSNLSFQLKPLTWMGWQIEWDYAQVRNQEAWGRNSEITGLPVFGDRATTQSNLTIRNTTTFTRDLTLQVYQQIFLAKGHYDTMRQLSTPSVFIAPDPSEPLLGDFNEQVLHTNVVLRWEYLPGSTFYLVWSQARNGNLGDFYSQFNSDVNNTFLAAPSNVILMKVSYLLSL